MGKWLNRVIDKGKTQEIKYQYPSKSNTDNVDIIREFDVTNPETKKTPKLDLLTEVELEAFNGWYATMRKPEHEMGNSNGLEIFDGVYGNYAPGWKRKVYARELIWLISVIQS